VKLALLEGLKGEEKEDLKNYLQNNKKVFDILYKIVYNMYRETEKRSYDYDSPSWPYLQAHVNGAKESLEKVLSVLQIEEKP
jgi:hypothetical protein